MTPEKTAKQIASNIIRHQEYETAKRDITQALRETRAEAFREAAEVARLYADENIEMANDTVFADPVLDGDMSAGALEKSHQLQIDGTIHSSAYHTAIRIAAAIEARAKGE